MGEVPAHMGGSFHSCVFAHMPKDGHMHDMCCLQVSRSDYSHMSLSWASSMILS